LRCLFLLFDSPKLVLRFNNTNTTISAFECTFHRNSCTFFAPFCQAELSQLASRADEIVVATKALSQRRDALTSQCSLVDARLSEARIKLDDITGQRTQLQQKVAFKQAEMDTLSAAIASVSSERVSVDNATIALLVRAALVRTRTFTLGQEIYAVRHRAEVDATARAAAAKESGNDDVGLFEPSERSSSAIHGVATESDGVEGLLRDISIASASRVAAAARGDPPQLPRFRDASLVSVGVSDLEPRFQASLSSVVDPPVWLSNDTRSELQIQRDAAAASLSYAQASLDRALQQGEQWLADKLSVAASTLEMKNQMDEAVSRIESLRDAYDNSSFALEDVKASVADLDFQAELLKATISSAAEAADAADKAGVALDARRQNLIQRLDNTQQERVTRIVTLQSSIRDKLAARRAAASTINNAQRQRLSLTQDVNALQQRVSLLEGSAATTTAAVEDLKQRRSSLSRQRDVLAAELQSATLREVTAKQRMQPLAQRRDRLIAAALRQASARDRLQAQAVRVSAMLEAARADAARRNSERATIAAAISTLQLKLGAAQEEFSQVQAGTQRALLDLDQLGVRQRSLEGDVIRLTQRMQESKEALLRASQRRDRAAANLAALAQKAARYAAVRASLSPVQELLTRTGDNGSVAASGREASVGNSSTAEGVARASAAPSQPGGAGFGSQIAQQIQALSATVEGRTRSST
jgi:chromosome segregation ATPase